MFYMLKALIIVPICRDKVFMGAVAASILISELTVIRNVSNGKRKQTSKEIIYQKIIISWKLHTFINVFCHTVE